MFHQGSVLDSSELILEYVDFMWPSSGGQAEVRDWPSSAGSGVGPFLPHALPHCLYCSSVLNIICCCCPWLPLIAPISIKSPSKRKRSPSIDPSFLGIGKDMIMAEDEAGFQAKKSEVLMDTNLLPVT